MSQMLKINLLLLSMFAIFSSSYAVYTVPEATIWHVGVIVDWEMYFASDNYSVDWDNDYPDSLIMRDFPLLKYRSSFFDTYAKANSYYQLMVDAVDANDVLAVFFRSDVGDIAYHDGDDNAYFKYFPNITNEHPIWYAAYIHETYIYKYKQASTIIYSNMLQMQLALFDCESAANYYQDFAKSRNSFKDTLMSIWAPNGSHTPTRIIPFKESFPFPPYNFPYPLKFNAGFENIDHKPKMLPGSLILHTAFDNSNETADNIRQYFYENMTIEGWSSGSGANFNNGNISTCRLNENGVSLGELEEQRDWFLHVNALFDEDYCQLVLDIIPDEDDTDNSFYTFQCGVDNSSYTGDCRNIDVGNDLLDREVLSDFDFLDICYAGLYYTLNNADVIIGGQEGRYLKLRTYEDTVITR